MWLIWKINKRETLKDIRKYEKRTRYSTNFLVQQKRYFEHIHNILNKDFQNSLSTQSKDLLYAVRIFFCHYLHWLTYNFHNKFFFGKVKRFIGLQQTQGVEVVKVESVLTGFSVVGL